MGLFSSIYQSRILKKEYTSSLESSYTETKSSKKFIVEKNETYYNGAAFFHELIKDNLSNLVVICIGTDKCIFDSLAPFVGSILKSRGFSLPIYGTIENPIHAVNISHSLIEIKKNHPNGFFIAIDACFSNKESQFQIHLRNYPIHPGAGVNKKLPSTGDVSIVGTIAVSNDDVKFSDIRLNDVLHMANKIADIIMEAVKSDKFDDLHKDNILNFANFKNKHHFK
ncbi:sporulation protein YyaC [Clostridium carboxidivorans P7]|uniref:Sporulation protein YyaC n=1 Tax=Clostridium carboxidivorans P7 TaxID=536227 RepID=C6PSW4_9CLOT|nr:spore protease YyaC [Clostridium carboxidivorans]EET87703.1 sporulation protein YyaC [Clostridium carboxidivorans P7]